MKKGGIANNFNRKDFVKCITSLGANYSEPYNQTIYKLFKEDPGHDNVAWAYTKVAGLDKLYSANLGLYLFSSKKEKQPIWLINKPDVHMALVKKLVGDGRRKRRFVGLLPPCATDNSRLVINNLKDVQKKVIELAAFIKELCEWTNEDGGDGPISFASKYLHFHSGIVPIFDKRASTVLYNLDTGKNVKNKILGYNLFCELFADALKSAYGCKKEYSTEEIKNLDGYLYYQSRGDWP